jgi:hypothetical protein
MPYIKENDRSFFDSKIEELVFAFKCSFKDKICKENNLSDEEFMMLLGKINYCFSRILGSLMGDVSYNKISMITGVIENIKQEYYRRVAETYEDKKILENGDIKEYKKLS